MTGTLVLVGGPSACGKTSIVNALLSAYPAVYSRPRTYTTRARRPGEGDGYSFVSGEEFSGLIHQQAILNVDRAYGALYGIDKTSLADIFLAHRVAIREVHPDNHHALRTLVTCISVFILPQELIAEPRSKERSDADAAMLRDISFDAFEIVVRTTRQDLPSVVAESLHEKICALIGR